ncbi:hypothetical protein FF36_01700 [Frankia torreyi]|uniref:Uncharacterized protein n=1 Tax=Frankia torreyi TaxID=1856 RepID=A0A0D8BIP3_9ACTN|nr:MULTISPECIES: hypothetical protein [Frankia]KJE24011.1 hypothetical protein FF36_01700 [Frankia torreyi]KQM07348.1 hypothetical protein FF86_100339 [Frankia sp. CpI1-P]
MVADRHLGLRPCHVYDYDGEYLGSFTSWSAAHEWAHLQAAMGGVPGPLEVEDRQLGQRRRVWVDRCADLLAAPPTAAETPAEAAHAPRPGGAGPDAINREHGAIVATLGAPVLCNVLDAPTVIPAQPRRSD